MAHHLSVEDRQKNADKFGRYATIGAVAFALYFVGILLGVSPAKPSGGQTILAIALFAIPAILIFVSLIQLFRFRRSDEFVEGLWNSGASAALITLIGFGFLLIVVGVFNDDALAKGITHDTDITLFAFFLAVTLKRWKAA